MSHHTLNNNSFKSSISKKLFTITFSLFVLFFSLTTIFEMAFFQTFYVNKKKNNLIQSIDRFKYLYSNNIPDDYSLSSAIENFQNQNLAIMAIFSPDGEIKYLLNKSDHSKSEIDFLITVFQNMNSNENFLPSLKKSGKTYSTVYENTLQDMKHIVCISPMSMQSENDSVILALSSFQSINEASAVIREFYSIVFIFLVIICLALSFIYTDMISKPLVSLTKIASKMSNFDFSSKCSEERCDEIGALGRSLNIMSSNLSSALDELKKKNATLEKDIEKERRLEKMRKEFIAGASHELKTPLGIIEGYAEGLKDNIVTGEDRDAYLDIIIDETAKMNKLVMDMLELSKLESENMVLKIEPFNIKNMISDILLKYKNNIQKHNYRLSFTLNQISCEEVLGDSFKIESVIENFLTNALKYTPEGENINVILAEKDDDILFSIENTGVHLTPDELDKIWVQFYRVDKARSRAQGSNGLGLSIVKTILKQHNSSFGAMNSKDGVVFYFTLKKYNNIK